MSAPRPESFVVYPVGEFPPASGGEMHCVVTWNDVEGRFEMRALDIDNTTPLSSSIRYNEDGSRTHQVMITGDGEGGYRLRCACGWSTKKDSPSTAFGAKDAHMLWAQHGAGQSNTSSELNT